MDIVLKRSDKPDKKYMVKVDNKTIHFGSRGMSDFTKNKDPERKNRYIARHKKRENWNDKFSPGALSRYILWGEPSLRESIKKYKRKFRLK